GHRSGDQRHARRRASRPSRVERERHVARHRRTRDGLIDGPAVHLHQAAGRATGAVVRVADGPARAGLAGRRAGRVTARRVLAWPHPWPLVRTATTAWEATR